MQTAGQNTFPATHINYFLFQNKATAQPGRTSGVRPSSALLTPISELTDLASVSLSSSGGEGQGEEAVVLSQHASYYWHGNPLEGRHEPQCGEW
jgi:hypothetical protein